MPRVAVTQELPPNRLAVRVADPVTGATVARFAEDEGQVENVIGDLRKTGEMPGGHKECTFSLARDPRRDYPDLAPYLDVFVEQAGGEIVWEGRIDKTSESDGERRAIDVECVGHQAALEDRKGVVAGFIDSDLSKWGESSTQRQLDSANSNFPLVAATSTGFQDKGELPPGLIIDYRNAESVEGKTECGELCYFGGGIDIGSVIAGFKNIGAVSEGSASWLDVLRLSIDDVLSTYFDGTNLHATTTAQTAIEAPDPGYKYAFAVAAYNGAGTFKYSDCRLWTSPRVIGRHGLPLRGEFPNIGFTSGQMLRYAVPLFSYLEATEESVEDSGYVIPQAWFSDPTTLAAIVQELTKYELLDWFVMNGKLFEQRVPGTYGRKWQAYAGPSELKDSGIDASRLWRTIKVAWQDVSGRTFTAGPPGSGAMFEDERLEITDPDHPAVKAGIEREDTLVLNRISTQERSIEAGERWLADATELTHSGTATLSGYVMDDKGVRRPVAQVLPGDEIRFPDAKDTSYRKITAPDYGEPEKKCAITLDAPPDGMQALLERFDAGLIRAGVS